MLRTRRSITAQRIAADLEVSTRTVYRDVQDLVESGVPVEGEAGIGYRLRKGFELPPLTFNVDELSALVFGARLVQTWADPELGRAVRSAMSKIEAVLPEPLQQSMLKTALFGPPQRLTREAPLHLARLRRAIVGDNWVTIAYRNQQDVSSDRTVVPLGLYFFAPHWLCAGYCMLRQDYRSFRVDRISDVSETPPDERASTLPNPCTLDAFIKAMETRDTGRPPPA